MKPLKAYENVDFLKTDVCRPVRLQLELLHPEVVMASHQVRSTIVLFGSARIPDPERARTELAMAEQNLTGNPESGEMQFRRDVAREMVKLSHYYNVAREFARVVSQCCQDGSKCEYVIMTGGGGGIMEAGNRGADDAGAKSVGLNISLPMEQQPNPYVTPELCFEFHYFSIRKMHFLLRAKALCGFPGGYGTLDELFETLTLISTNKIHRIPVILFGREFWEEIINWPALVRRGVISPEDIDIFSYCETAEEGWQLIQDFWRGRNGVAWRNRHKPG